MQNPRLDCFEQNPTDWWMAAQKAISACTAQIDADQVQGIAISNQRETVAFIDANGEASYPAILWLDERCRDEVVELTERFGAEEIHRITGRHPDITPCVYRLRWLQKNEPKAWANTAHFVDVQAYLVKQLCGGHFRTGWFSADPMGMIDMEHRDWSKPMLDALSIDASMLPELHAPGAQLGTVRLCSREAVMVNVPVWVPTAPPPSVRI